MCLGGCGEEPVLRFFWRRTWEGFLFFLKKKKRIKTKIRQVEFDTQTHTRLRMRPPTHSLGFQQTSSGWNDECLARCICFLHITGRQEGGGGGMGRGRRRRQSGAAIDMPHAVPTPD